jgi:hypothetical protein
MADEQTGGRARARTRAAPKKRATKKVPKVKTIRDRIKEGAKVHVGKRNGLYLQYDGKKHTVC